MTTASPTALQTFAYQAQANFGKSIAGTIEADDVQDARSRLSAMGLRVLNIEPTAKVRHRGLGSSDAFAAFNQQLAQLAASGLPIERGIRLIAQDMRGGRLAYAAQALADDLERGRSLPEAFAAHRDAFPPLYANLLEAGIASHNLPGMLLNFGRHLEMTRRLRTVLWRASVYPLTLFVMLLAVLVFIGWFIVPPYREFYEDFGAELPSFTKALFWTADWLPAILLGLVALCVVVPMLWRFTSDPARGGGGLEKLKLALPLIGPVLHANLIARWCDALRLCVEAGMDLPRALRITSQAIASPGLEEDSERLIALLESGQPIDVLARRAMLPAVVPATLRFGAEGGDLPGTLAKLSALYEQQAELRLGVTQLVLLPVFLVVIALFVWFVVGGLFLPLVRGVKYVSA